MKPIWGEIPLQLKTAYDQIEKALPNLPNITYNVLAFSPQEMLNSFRLLIEQMDATQNIDVDAVLFAVHAPNIITQMPNFISIVNTYVAQGGISPYSEQLVNHIWSFFSSLSYILPADRVSKPLHAVITKDSKTQLSELQKLNAILEKSYEHINLHQKKIDKVKHDIEIVLQGAKQDAEEAANAKTNAEKNVLQSATSRDTFEQLLLDVEAGKLAADSLLIELKKLKDDAETVLGLASQGALAKAFENRKDTLLIAQKQWVQYFGAGLLGLFTLTLVSVALSEFFHLPPVFKDGGFDTWGVVLRVLLGSPILWFTWFAVRQFGNNVALIEDYAFKEASALAFVGYKKDMEDDVEMLKLLRESAIHNFAAAPSRLISKSEAASPLHDIFEKAMNDKNSSKKLIEILKALKPNKTS